MRNSNARTTSPLRTAGRIAILNAVKQEHVTVVGAADGNVLHERHLLQLLKHLVNGLEGERLHMFVCVSVSCARCSTSTGNVVTAMLRPPTSVITQSGKRAWADPQRAANAKIRRHSIFNSRVDVCQADANPLTSFVVLPKTHPTSLWKTHPSSHTGRYPPTQYDRVNRLCVKTPLSMTFLQKK